jgi:hypothetical protein
MLKTQEKHLVCQLRRNKNIALLPAYMNPFLTNNSGSNDTNYSITRNSWHVYPFEPSKEQIVLRDRWSHRQVVHRTTSISGLDRQSICKPVAEVCEESPVTETTQTERGMVSHEEYGVVLSCERKDRFGESPPICRCNRCHLEIAAMKGELSIIHRRSFTNLLKFYVET